MKFQKAALVVIGIFVITGTAMFQLSSLKRPAQGTATPPRVVPGSQPSAGSAVPSPGVGEQPEPRRIPVASNLISIPPRGWGRDPLLTMEEIAALNRPEEQPPVAVAPEPPKPEPFPEITLTGIISNPNGAVAIIDSQVVRVGDHIKSETVKEIKPGSVVLESGGKTREIPLKSTGADARPPAAKGQLQ